MRERKTILSFNRLLSFSVMCLLLVLVFAGSSCHIYSFKDIGTIPDSIHVVKVKFFENNAPYKNPQLSPTLSERLRRKISNQTKLNLTNGENADWVIDGNIIDYSVSTSGIS